MNDKVGFEFDVFISYSHQDQQWVEGWLVPRLSAAGIRICTDRNAFDVGVPAIVNIENAVCACRHVLLVLTPAWVESQWTSFESILAQHQDPANLTQRILPVLRQTCFPPPRIATMSYADLRDGADIQSEFGNLLAALYSQRRLPRAVAFRPPVSSGPLDEERRRIMIERVRNYWVEGVLERSLYNAVLIELEMREDQRAVNHPWNMFLRAEGGPDIRIPPHKDIAEVFDQDSRALLILGEPGSGKTTMLLELTRTKLLEAERDHHLAIPAVFPLSSWSNKQQDIADWLIEELNLKYHIDTEVARSWVARDQLILLLDGLDEVRKDLRGACVKAINRFRLVHGFAQLVVCARTANYKEIGHRLDLDAAILLQPLSPQQISDYIDRAQGKLDPLRNAIHSSGPLGELAQSPLMLNIMAFVCRDSSPRSLRHLNSAEELRESLFKMYISRRLNEVRSTGPYPIEQAISWLAWLAKNMSRNSQSIFLLERIQPSWLIKRRWVYSLCVLALVFLLSSISSIVGLLKNASSGLILSSIVNCSVATLIAAVYVDKDIRTVEIIRWSPKKALLWCLLMLAFPLIGTVIVWFNRPEVMQFITRPNYRWGEELQSPELTQVKLIAAGGLYLLVYLYFHYVEKRTGKLSTKSMGCLFILMSYAYLEIIINSIVMGLFDSLHGKYFFGLTGSVDSLAGYLRISLVTALPVAMIVGVLSGLTRKELVERVKVNQGIRQSARNSILTPVIIGVVILMLIWLGSSIVGLSGSGLKGAGKGTSEVKSMAVRVGALFQLWFILALPSGAFACIKHYSLRVVLYLRGYMPWNYAHFLDYAADHCILQKVGGGYVFIHGMLLEYLATLKSDSNL